MASGEGGDPGARGTRARLLEAGLRLFAERGFHSVRVGDIEQAVGLAPRRGAMYRHFESKEALLTAAVELHLASVEAARSLYAGGSDPGIGNAAEVAGFILAEMDRQRLITQVLERDGDRLPALRQRFRREVSDSAYQTMAAILRGWLATTQPGMDPQTLDALAVHLVGALVNARRSAWTLGAPPLGLSDDELIAGWTLLCQLLVRSDSAPVDHPPGADRVT